MSDRNRTTETEKVVKRVLKTAAKYDRIGKTEFEDILHKVMQQVRRNTGIESDTISQTTKKVLEDMPNEYGQLSEADRTWEALSGRCGFCLIGSGCWISLTWRRSPSDLE